MKEIFSVSILHCTQLRIQALNLEKHNWLANLDYSQTLHELPTGPRMVSKTSLRKWRNVSLPRTSAENMARAVAMMMIGNFMINEAGRELQICRIKVLEWSLR